MKVLGIVGSRRKLGNTEILVKEALRGAEEEGAQVSLLRMSDFYFTECNGCMACTRGEPCRLKDDLDLFIQQIEATDGLIAGAPSYNGMPPGTFKTVQDRVVFQRWRLRTGRPAVSLGIAGGAHIAWWVVPMLNVFIHSCGFDVLESFIAGSQGPGESLLPERQTLPSISHRMGRDLVYAIRGEMRRLSEGAHKLMSWNWAAHGFGDERLHIIEECCPYCFGQAVTPYHGDHRSADPLEVECAFCHNSTGKLVEKGGRLVLHLRRKTDDEIEHERVEHMEGWVKPSGPLFMARREEVMRLRAPYGSMYEFVKPPREQPAT